MILYFQHKFFSLTVIALVDIFFFPYKKHFFLSNTLIVRNNITLFLHVSIYQIDMKTQ